MATYAAGTEAPSDRSRTEIERTLKRYGARAFAYVWEGDEAPAATIAFKLATGEPTTGSTGRAGPPPPRIPGKQRPAPRIMPLVQLDFATCACAHFGAI